MFTMHENKSFWREHANIIKDRAMLEVEQLSIHPGRVLKDTITSSTQHRRFFKPIDKKK